MYLVARTDKSTGLQIDWLVEVTLSSEQIHVTRMRKNARRFRSEADAQAVRDRVASITPDDNWKVVNA